MEVQLKLDPEKYKYLLSNRVIMSMKGSAGFVPPPPMLSQQDMRVSRFAKIIVAVKQFFKTLIIKPA